MREQIKRIEVKVQQMLKQYQLVQKENLQLQRENFKMKEQIEKSNAEVKQLQQKIDALKMSSGPMDENSKKELEKRINIYLKDIDKCLALLHN